MRILIIPTSRSANSTVDCRESALLACRMEVLAMADQEKSREALGLAFQRVKSLHLTLAALMTDVAALRHVVLKGSKKSKLYRRETRVR